MSTASSKLIIYVRIDVKNELLGKVISNTRRARSFFISPSMINISRDLITARVDATRLEVLLLFSLNEEKRIL